MRTHDDAVDPAIAAELDALERVLAGDAAADPELAALVREVRADAPAARPGFRAGLDERVAAGFPRERRPPRLPRVPRARLLVPAAGLAATILAGVAVVGLTGGGDDHATGPAAAPQEAVQSAPAARSGAGGASGSDAGAAPPATAPTVAAPPAAALGAPSPPARAPRRKVERAVTIALRTTAHRLQDVADRVVAVTQSAGGFVARSQVDATDRSGAAAFTLRLPARTLDDSVRRLSALAHVASMSRSATDITAVFDDARDRLADARREHSALLRALGRATTAGEIASVRARLRENRSAIARAKGDVAAARRRADLATVQLTIEGRRAAHGGGAGTGGDDSWSAGDAAGDALRVLEVATGVVLVGAAATVPLALLAALAWIAARAGVRRRREQGLARS